jgi:hypothetical protein
LENGAEGSKIPKIHVRWIFARVAEVPSRMKPVFSLEDFESGKIAPNPGWLKEVWDKWPGDESIEELLAALDGDSLLKNRKKDEE